MSFFVPWFLIWSMSFKWWTSLQSHFTNASSFASNSFAFEWTFILEALSANFKVEIDSSIVCIKGFKVAIKIVVVFPPNESLSNLVNLDSLYGITYWFFESAETTLPNVERDKFILLCSSICFSPSLSSK